MTLPRFPMSRDQILDTLAGWRAGDLDPHDGRAFAYVFPSGLSELEEVAAQASRLFLWHNGLDPTVFPSLLRMENEVVAMLAGHLGGGPGTTAPDVVGTVTSGGTESCLLAVKAARDRCADVAHPRLLLPVTAHAAFRKAAHLFGLQVDTVPVDPTTARPDPVELAAAITSDTVLVVVSAPSYAHGVVDPVAEVAAAAASRGVACHVDACIGGVVLPYLRRLGDPVPAFGFEVPGVTSVSVDLHKYGYAPKGVSVLLHREPALRTDQLWACADWTGYAVVNATLQSTKSAAPLAAAWAVLRYLGDDGFLRLTSTVRDATRALLAGVERIAGLRPVVPTDSPLVALAGTGDPPTDVFALVDAMATRGWHLQPQPGRFGLPHSVHLTVTPAAAPRVDALVSDLVAATEEVRAAPPVEPAPLATLLANAVDEGLSPDVVSTLLAAAGDGGPGPLPAQMAPLNAALAALPPAQVEALLVALWNALFRPTPPS